MIVRCFLFISGDVLVKKKFGSYRFKYTNIFIKKNHH